MKKLILLSGLLSFLYSCDKSKIEKGVEIRVSPGSTMEVNGLIGNESGTAAGNMVFIDFSEDKQTPLVRAKWDLAFYCGNDYRVRINNSTAAMAVVLDKTDLNAVTSEDANGHTFEVDISAPSAETFAKLDDIAGAINKTVIPEIKANAAENKVVIIGRGTGGAVPQRDLIKAKFGRTESGDYTVEWGKLSETTYKTATISKDANFNFIYLSFDDGILATAEPAKAEWDIIWGTSIYETPNGNEMSAYIFSDLIAVNQFSGVQTVEKTYDNENVVLDAFENYSLADAQNETFNAGRWSIGSKWRVTAAPGVSSAGVRKDRFYVVKDAGGNYYKLIFLSFSADDGGVRGRPKFTYELLK